MIDFSEAVYIAMENKNVNKSKLAKLLRKSRSFVSQLLNGSSNVTLRTLSDIAFVLGFKASIQFETIDKVVKSNLDKQFEGLFVIDNDRYKINDDCQANIFHKTTTRVHTIKMPIEAANSEYRVKVCG